MRYNPRYDNETTEVRFMRKNLIEITAGTTTGGSYGYPCYWSFGDKYAIQKTKSTRYLLVYTPQFRLDWHNWPEDMNKTLEGLLEEKDDETLIEWCECAIRHAVSEKCQDPDGFKEIFEAIYSKGHSVGVRETQARLKSVLGIRERIG